MATRSTAEPAVAIRRIVACERCGGRRRSLHDTAHGVRALCVGCGADVAFPLATEQLPMLPLPSATPPPTARPPALVPRAAGSHFSFPHM